VPRRLENDRWLFGVTLALCLFGAVMIFSASAVTAEQQYGHSYIFLVRQAAWLFIGLLGMFALMKTDYRRLREPSVIYPVVCVVLLLLVGTFFLDKSHATHRWIKFGPVGIQPSELAKLATILYLAWFLDHKRRNKASMEFRKEDFWRTIFPAAGPILVFVALILLQPDLGTSIDILVVAAAILFVGGLSWKWLAVGLAGAIPMVYLLITQVAYRQARLTAFLHPDSDPQGAGFQLLQSLIAVGSGGFTGGTVAGVTLGITVGSDLTRTNCRCCSREPVPLMPPPPPPAAPGPPPPTTSERVKSDDPTIGARMRKRISACTSSDAMTPFHCSSFLRRDSKGV